jgi:phosphonopyruvate decarboxylase
MIDPNTFIDALKQADIRFITGVPDSLLKDVCACITTHFSDKDHIIATNEGSAVGLGIGHYLATGRPPLIYMQNSGLGNIVNPILSLSVKEVYGIPMVLMVGWRGEILETGEQLKDEPQHVKQGQITLQQLELMGVPYTIVDDESDILNVMLRTTEQAVKLSKPFAIVVRKNSFSPFKLKQENLSSKLLSREEIVRVLLSLIPKESPIVATTGKTSRELFELRKERSEGHNKDFLTVGGMGHASQIACGIAKSIPNKKVYCLDGDGAFLMHMGGLTIGADLENLVHIVINNGAHDSVGGQPTNAANLDLTKIAAACGYKEIESAETEGDIIDVLTKHRTTDRSLFLEIKCTKGARSDLGRPDRTPQENKLSFMEFLME